MNVGKGTKVFLWSLAGVENCCLKIIMLYEAPLAWTFASKLKTLVIEDGCV
jgi:hypothetical protein